MKWQLTLFVVLAYWMATGMASAEPPKQIDFNFHIKPILADRCFVCHGPDAENRQADLRLDTREGAMGKSQYGAASHIIRPGDLNQSELYRRIVSTDPDERMPPPDSNLELAEREIDAIRRWIDQGAEWKNHWSLIPPGEVSVPEVQETSWPANPIDFFVLARLESEGLHPAPVAAKEMLIRRLTYDLTGLPPTLDEIDNYLADDSPGAYERVVDRLLSSHRFGERMAVDWLDAARYADTYGYQTDVQRDMSPWRDWVVRALNQNLPYDEFITWQLAGDLLPRPTRDQVLATAFNRNHRQTNEGGSIEEEFRVEYVADRVNTFGAALLGLTLECCRCHDHKYDPFTQNEYYQLFSFFNSIDESGLYSHFTDAIPTPTLLLATDEQQGRMDAIAGQIADAESSLEELARTRTAAFDTWLKATNGRQPAIGGLLGDFGMDEIDGGMVVNRADEKRNGKTAEGPRIVPGKAGGGLRLSGENNLTTSVGGDFTRNDTFSIALWINTPDRKERAVILHRSRAWTDAGSRGYELLIEDGCLSASLVHFWPGNAIGIRTVEPVPVDKWVHVALTYDGSSRAAGLKLYVDGRQAECDTVRDNLYKNITGGGASELTVGQRFRDRGFQDGTVDELRLYGRELTPLEIAQVCDGVSLASALAANAGERSPEQVNALLLYYLHQHDPVYQAALESLRQLRIERSRVADGVAEIMVMRELPEPRPTFVLKRGAYDAPGEAVSRDTPASLLPWPDDEPRNRLGLARWLTDPRHPLTARVAVNRFWQNIFGRGLVATSEDFGRQGQLPSHPELLDWLARGFVDSGWDVKALVKQIAMSATYRQSSECAPLLRARDPDNALLGRGSSYRLPAEMIRDGALSAGGLLVERLGGPPVKPYQPAGLWEEKSGARYVRDEGAGSHRRSLYTFWKRTSPPPAMMMFDAPTREVCVARRQPTATPLQALVLLNDPQYVEAAVGLAQRTIRANPNLDDRIVYAFRTLTSRRPTGPELELLKALYEEQCEDFQLRPADAEKLLAVGDKLADSRLDAVTLAATTVLIQALANYDETVRKR